MHDIAYSIRKYVNSASGMVAGPAPHFGMIGWDAPVLVERNETVFLDAMRVTLIERWEREEVVYMYCGFCTRAFILCLSDYQTTESQK